MCTAVRRAWGIGTVEGLHHTGAACEGLRRGRRFETIDGIHCMGTKALQSDLDEESESHRELRPVG